MNTPHRKGSRRGFTLVEIMIVVVIIGLLAAMAIPAFNNVREGAQNSTVMNGFRVYAGAFQTFALDNGYYPADVGPSTLPEGMEGYIDKEQFESEEPMGGKWDWQESIYGVVAGISVNDPIATPQQILRLDEAMDDGNLSTGLVIYTSNRLIYVIEE